jgi:hypothetical protein
MGVPLEQGMIANARKILQAWSLNLAGIAVRTPYTYILPSEWADIESNDIGWTTFESTASSYSRHYESHKYGLHTGEWRGESSATSGSGGLSVFGFGFSGSHGQQDSSNSSGFSSQGSDGSVLTSGAKNMTVSFQYGLCQVIRPWMLSDVMRMKNYFVKGQKAGSISSGKLDEQVGDLDKLLPMLPTSFIVVRNVRIHASDWGSVQSELTSYWDKETAASNSSSSTTSGGLSIPVFGPLSVSAGASHSASSYSGSFKDEFGRDVNTNYGAHFNGQTLEIDGAQVVAVLSEILPECPPMSDPNLPG